MDILKFVNSPYIRHYLKEIDYQPGAVEGAYLIYMSYTETLEEKMAAWEELMETVPDCAVTLGNSRRAKKSFYTQLRKYMDAIKKMTSEFFENKNCVYSFRCHVASFCPDPDFWTEQSTLYADFDTCVTAYHDYIKETDEGYAELVEFTRHKIISDGEPSSCPDVFLYWNEADQKMLPPFIDGKDGSAPKLFEYLWVDIPTPFRCGDIVLKLSRYESYSGGPYVLHSLPTWDKKTMLERGVPANDALLKHADARVSSRRNHGESYNMAPYACYYDEHRLLRMGASWSCNYLDLTLAGSHLDGWNRLLLGVSSYLKGKISVEVLVNTSLMIQSRESMMERWLYMFYHEDEMHAVGLRTPVE